MMWPAFAVWWEGKILTNGSFERCTKSSFFAKKTHSSLSLRRRRWTLHPTQSNPFIYFFPSPSSSLSSLALVTSASVLYFLSSPFPYPSVQLTDHISTDLPLHSRADLHFIRLLLFLSQAVPVNNSTSCFVRCNLALLLSFLCHFNRLSIRPVSLPFFCLAWHPSHSSCPVSIRESSSHHWIISDDLQSGVIFLTQPQQLFQWNWIYYPPPLLPFSLNKVTTNSTWNLR